MPPRVWSQPFDRTHAHRHTRNIFRTTSNLPGVGARPRAESSLSYLPVLVLVLVDVVVSGYRLPLAYVWLCHHRLIDFPCLFANDFLRLFCQLEIGHFGKRLRPPKFPSHMGWLDQHRHGIIFPVRQAILWPSRPVFRSCQYVVPEHHFDLGKALRPHMSAAKLRRKHSHDPAPCRRARQVVLIESMGTREDVP
jgi:hypothetical protein